MTTQLIEALTEKKNELISIINDLKTTLDMHKDNLLHIEATIQIFNGTSSKTTEKRPRERLFFNGELPRLLLDMLRDSTVPLTTTELSFGIMKHKGMDVEDIEGVKLLKDQVIRCLSRQKSLGILSSNKTEGKEFNWFIL